MKYKHLKLLIYILRSQVYRLKLSYKELAAPLMNVADIAPQPREIFQSEWEYSRLSEDLSDRGRRKKVL